MHWFRNRVDAKVGIEQWRRHYAGVRPHSSLGYQTPAEFKAQQVADGHAGRSPALLARAHQDEHEDRAEAASTNKPMGAILQ